MSQPLSPPPAGATKDADFGGSEPPVRAPGAPKRELERAKPSKRRRARSGAGRNASAAGIPGTSAAPPPVLGSDAEVVSAAYRKLMNRQELSVREKKAVARHEKVKEERLRWQYYGAIPHKHWKQMSGRQSKVIREQAVRYGLPFDGPAISLPAVVRALHDFLSDNASKLARDEEAELMESGPGSPALERYREERAILARLDRQQREGELIPREQARLALGRIAAILRGAGDTLQRQFGLPAAEIYFEALDEASRAVDQMFAATDGSQDEHDDGDDDLQSSQPPGAEPAAAGTRAAA